MARLYRRARSANWYFHFEIDGRRFRGSTGETNEREARKVLADMRERAGEEAKRSRLRTGPPLTWGEASRTYFDEVGQHQVASRKTAWSLNWLGDQIGPATLLQDITPSMVAQLVAKRRGEAKQCGGTGKLSHATVNRSVTEPLRKVLLHAHEVHDAEIKKIDWSKHILKEAAARVRYLKVEEEQALFEAARDCYAPIIRFALLTGCRFSECVGLTWDDVNFGSNELVIRGKGGTVEPIEIPPIVRDLLWSLRGHHPQQVFTYEVARTRDGRHKGERRPITVNGLGTAWTRLKRECGLRDFRFHDLRHSAATRLLRAGGNLALVQKTLRHRRIETTMRYAHVIAGDMAKVMQAAGEAAATAQLDAATVQTTATQTATPKK